jgi:exosortase
LFWRDRRNRIDAQPMSRRNLYLGLLVVIALAVFATPFSRLLLSSISEPTYTHILVVGPASISLILLRRASIFSSVRFSVVAGASVMIVAGILMLTRSRSYNGLTGNDSYSLMMLSLVLWCVGSFVLVYGVAAARKAIFPLLFLGLLVPLPDFLRDHVVRALQTGSTTSVDYLFNIASIPVFRDRFLLYLPTRAIEIAPQCSGIRAAIFLLVLTLFSAHLFLKEPWTKFLLVMTVFPIAAIKNGFRIFTLTVLDMYVLPGTLDGDLHNQGGSIFFVISLVGLYFVVRLLILIENRLLPSRTEVPSSPAQATEAAT